MTAAIAEVEVNRTNGKVTVKRVTLAQDCGLIVNPDGTKNQIEGNVIQGVSRTLLEEVKFDASGIKSLDWVELPGRALPGRSRRSTSCWSTGRRCRRWEAASRRWCPCRRRLPMPSSTRPARACAKYR